MPLPPENVSAPTRLEILYTTAYGRHVQTMKLREWISGADLGSVPRWSDDNPVDVLEMLDDFLALEKLTLDTTTNFTQARLYTQATPDSPSVLRKVVPLDVDGASAAAGWFKAVQLSINGFDVEGKPSRIVILDAKTGNDFDKYYTGGISAAVTNLWNEFAADTNGWSSQANNKPESLLSQTATLNEKLRREYGMV